MSVTPLDQLTIGVFGADVERLSWSAGLLRQAANEFDGHAGSLDVEIRTVHWIGGAAAEFESRWNTVSRSDIAAVAAFLREAADTLDRNAREQSDASGQQASASAPTGPGPLHASGGGGKSGSWGGDPPSHSPIDELAQAVGTLGGAQSTLDDLAELAEVLAGDGTIDPLIDLLTDPHFVTAVKGFGHVLDVGGFVVDLVHDFAANPTLDLDQRIVHALADASLRFGISEGVEKGVEVLSTVLIASVLPGVGGVAGFFAGQLIGEIAGFVTDTAIEQFDNATDFVDWAADRVVDLYAMFDSWALGPVEALFDVAGDAVDLGVGVGDAVVDFHLEVADHLVGVGSAGADAVGDAAGAVGDGLGATGDAIGGAASAAWGWAT